MYLGQFGFFWVLGRRSEAEPTRSNFGKKDPPLTAGVVGSARFRLDLPGGLGLWLSWTPLL